MSYKCGLTCLEKVSCEKRKIRRALAQGRVRLTVNLTTKVDSLPLYSPSPGAPPRLVVPPRGRWSKRFFSTPRLRLYVRSRLWFFNGFFRGFALIFVIV